MPGPPAVPKLKLGHVLKPGSKGGSSAASGRGHLFESSRTGAPTPRLTSRSQLGSARIQISQSARNDWLEDSARHGGSGWVEQDGFDCRVFLGTWDDNLSHVITVTECHQRRRGHFAFSAKFQRDGANDKTFTISWSCGEGGDWTCGNGRLVRGESSANEIVWRSDDGRQSEWMRASVDEVVDKSPPIISDSQDDWPLLGGTAVKAPVPLSTSRALDDGSHPDPTVSRSRGHALSSSASEFVPRIPGAAAVQTAHVTQAAPSSSRALGGTTTPRPTPRESFDIATPLGTPAVRPQPSPLPGPRSPLAMLPQPSLEIEMLQDSQDVCVLPGGRLEWILPDKWLELSGLPQNFCISSPLFGVDRAPSLQLVFFPGGSRTAEHGQCTLALLRGPDCVGLKFEMILNGRCSGPKACVSQRYLGDFPRPRDAAEDRALKVFIEFRVLETFEIKV